MRPEVERELRIGDKIKQWYILFFFSWLIISSSYHLATGKELDSPELSIFTYAFIILTGVYLYGNILRIHVYWARKKPETYKEYIKVRKDRKEEWKGTGRALKFGMYFGIPIILFVVGMLVFYPPEDLPRTGIIFLSSLALLVASMIPVQYYIYKKRGAV